MQLPPKAGHLTCCKVPVKLNRKKEGIFINKSNDSKFRSHVALEVLLGELTDAEITGKYQIHPNQVQQRKKKLMEGASKIFQSKTERKESRIPRTI